MKSNTKGQIMIYVLIALFIFILVAFLVGSSFDEKKDNIYIGKKDNKPLNEELLIIKTRVDYCLSNEFKKALIIAGLRGGNIYDDNEYVFSGIIPEDTYTPKFISNLNLDWNNLQSSVIVYSDEIPTPYEINNNSLEYKGKRVFTHTTKDDFTRFIASGFGRCLTFDDLEDVYDFSYKDFSGDVVNIDYVNKKIIIDNIDAKVGDEILVDIGNGNITGQVVEKLTENLFEVSVNNVLQIKEYNLVTIENLDVINLNNSIKIDVEFNDEDVVLKATYPVELIHKNASVLFEDTTIKQDIRFQALLKFASEMINTKYYHNKSIDYTNATNVYNALNNSLYFKHTGYRDLKIFKTDILNEDDHKKIVYSIVDDNFKINGNPYVFNFGYENVAPFVNFNNINTEFNIDEQSNTVVLVTSQGDTLKYDLRSSTLEKQAYDRETFYFKEESYSSVDADFNLDKYGNLTFTPKREQIYTYPIYVTDGETIRKHTIQFVTGFPGNQNNSALGNCVSFKNYPDAKNLFPINVGFKNKIYSYNDNGYNNAFALSQYYPNGLTSPNVGSESVLLFSKTCLFDPTKYYINVKKSDSGGNFVTLGGSDIKDSGNYYEIKVPIISSEQNYQIEIIDNSAGTVMTEPFNITIYPTRCLGPNPNPAGFNVSCCNTNLISQKINEVINLKNPSHLSALKTDNLLKKGLSVFNEKMYACIDLEQYSYISNMFNFSDQDAWSQIDTDITSLFETNVVIECGGEYPTLIKNINSISISGGKSFGTLKGIQSTNTVDSSSSGTPVSLKVVQQANKCEFCDLNSTSLSIVSNYKGKNFVFDIGTVNYNPISIIKIPNLAEFNNLYILADNSWYGSSKPNPVSAGDWNKITGIFGQGGNPQPVAISKGYCQQNSNAISGRKNSPTYKQEIDFAKLSGCADYYFDTSNPSSIPYQGNIGWSCGTDMVCQGNFCKSVTPPTPSP